MNSLAILAIVGAFSTNHILLELSSIGLTIGQKQSAITIFKVHFEGALIRFPTVFKLIEIPVVKGI